MIANARADGVILATPNQAHVEGGLACIAAGLPVLVEKPLATDLADARRLVEAAEAAAMPLLTGHHRRHNPLIAAAKAAIVAGELGTLVSVNAMVWLMKPDDYFDVRWRREPGGGPDLPEPQPRRRPVAPPRRRRSVSVAAWESEAVRGFAVEDSAVVLLRFANGALGTVNVSDTIPAPWSWELTAGENAAYPRTDEACYLIGGTLGSLELPKNRAWQQPGRSELVGADLGAHVARCGRRPAGAPDRPVRGGHPRRGAAAGLRPRGPAHPRGRRGDQDLGRERRVGGARMSHAFGLANWAGQHLSDCKVARVC